MATTVKKPRPLERTEENIARITQDLHTEGFVGNSPQQIMVFNLILECRLNGYTQDNCPHPRYVPDGQFMLCTNCGHSYLT